MPKVTDKTLQELEKKAKEEVEELLKSSVKDVEYIEVFYKDGHTDVFEENELESFWKISDNFVEIRTKTKNMIINLNETIKIITNKKI